LKNLAKSQKNLDIAKFFKKKLTLRKFSCVFLLTSQQVAHDCNPSMGVLLSGFPMKKISLGNDPASSPWLFFINGSPVE
jgi:hypothetical protein